MLRRDFFHLRPSRISSPLKPHSFLTTSMSSNSQSASPPDQSDSQAHSSPEKALPAPGENSDGATILDVSGNGTTVKLDGLGPMVVNQDGTISRISNWSNMAEIEQNNTLRIIGKRNQTRLAALRKAQESGNESGSGGSQTGS
ncbi:hypothetical protein PT974_02507 [Cladobotryum mycophilum]|uniref:Uncharacterized protein n=1 Tax=Cladobotryum mycophilum TaxID=491253 RepID=A0ABR0SYA4_9HYPO